MEDTTDTTPVSLDASGQYLGQPITQLVVMLPDPDFFKKHYPQQHETLLGLLATLYQSTVRVRIFSGEHRAATSSPDKLRRFFGAETVVTSEHFELRQLTDPNELSFGLRLTLADESVHCVTAVTDTFVMLYTLAFQTWLGLAARKSKPIA